MPECCTGLAAQSRLQPLLYDAAGHAGHAGRAPHACPWPASPPPRARGAALCPATGIQQTPVWHVLSRHEAPMRQGSGPLRLVCGFQA